MAKVEISVTRSMTINTGDYNSIKPTVTLTVSDLDPANVSDAYLAVDDAITGLMKIEILNSTGELNRVNQGLQEFCHNIKGNVPEIGANIEKSLERLNEF